MKLKWTKQKVLLIWRKNHKGTGCIRWVKMIVSVIYVNTIWKALAYIEEHI